MIRVVKLSNKWYGKEIRDVEADEENINVFVSEGTPVIIVDDLIEVRFFLLPPKLRSNSSIGRATAL